MGVAALRLYWVVGELSAEQHVVGVLRELRRLSPQPLALRGMGGPQMAQLGVELVADWHYYAVVGFVEVFRNLGRFLALYRRLKADIAAWRPDRLILVDYPGLNLRLARWAVRQGIPVTYFIPPQLWAWNPSRVRHLRHPAIQLLCILPFEPDFYAKYGIQATYVGHPLVEQLAEVALFSAPEPYIALLPGSRLHEVRNILPHLAALPNYFPQYRFYVSKVPHLPLELYKRAAPDLEVIEGQTHALLKGATAAVVTSGTATLEAALLGCPSVIVYRGNYLSYWIARQLVRVPFIGLPNLILGERVFPELIQGECTAPKIAQALAGQLAAKAKVQAQLHQLQSLLGQQAASRYTAEALLSQLEEKQLSQP